MFGSARKKQIYKLTMFTKTWLNQIFHTIKTKIGQDFIQQTINRLNQNGAVKLNSGSLLSAEFIQWSILLYYKYEIVFTDISSIHTVIYSIAL